MKSKIAKEWYLILLTSVLAIHSYDVIARFILYLPHASEYKHPLVLWTFHILKIVLSISVWYMLFTHHAKLLLAVKLLLGFIVLTLAIPNLYFAIINFKDNYNKEGFNMLMTSLIYFTITISLYLLSKKHIVKIDDKLQIDDNTSDPRYDEI